MIGELHRLIGCKRAVRVAAAHFARRMADYAVGHNAELTKRVGERNLNCSDCQHAVERIVLVLRLITVAQHRIDVFAKLVERRAAAAQRLVENGHRHQLLRHARPLRAHAGVYEPNRPMLGNRNLLYVDVRLDGLAGSIVHERAAKWCIFRRQIRLKIN